MLKRVLLFFIVILFFTNCKKEISDAISASIYTNAKANNQECIYLFPSPEGGAFVISNTDNQTNPLFPFVVFTKYAPSGKQDWSIEVPSDGNPKVTQLKDGSLLMISNSPTQRLIKIDQAGNIILNKVLTDTLPYGCVNPIEGENNHYFSLPAKPAPWLFDTSAILEFDEGGNLMANQKIKTFDFNFNGLMFTQFIYKVKSPKIVYFCGLIYENPVNVWANPHVFISRFEYSNNKIITKKNVQLDVSNQSIINDGSNFHFLNIPNDNLLILNQQIEPNNIYRSQLIKIDNDLNKVWDIAIKAGVGNTFGNSVRLCPDGSYLIAGDCQVSGKSIYQPFAMKVSEDGKILWTKTYDIKGYGRLTSGFQYNNGSILLGGSTTGFGNGFNLKDLLLMKTDENGNIE